MSGPLYYCTTNFSSPVTLVFKTGSFLCLFSNAVQIVIQSIKFLSFSSWGIQTSSSCSIWSVFRSFKTVVWLRFSLSAKWYWAKFFKQVPSSVTVCGYVNKQNFRYWSDKKVHQLHQKHLRSAKVTVRYAITFFAIIGLYFSKGDNRYISPLRPRDWGFFHIGINQI